MEYKLNNNEGFLIKKDGKTVDVMNLALGAVYDVSAKNPTAGPNSDGKFTLEYILDQNNVNTLIPTSVRRGGMSIKFVQSSDNKYIQARCMAKNFTTDITQWQGVDTKITSGSKNLAESGAAFAALFHDNDWNNAPEFKACITRDGFVYDNADGNCKIFTIKPNDVISITGGSNGGYAAILSDLPIYGVATAPYATYHTNRYVIQANTVVDITVNANSNAKYLIVEASRTIDNAVIDETPAAFTINGITMLVDRKTLIDKCIGNLKQGIFVPRFTLYITITSTTITIPNKSRIIYDNSYYQNSGDITLNRQSGAQYDIVVFNTSTQNYEIINNSYYNFANINYIYCFYVRENGECSLPTSLYKYDGNFVFVPNTSIDSEISVGSSKIPNDDAVVSALINYDNVWDDTLTFKAIITKYTFDFSDENGICKIFKIKQNDVISITGGSNGGYAAVLYKLPTLGNTTIPFATGYNSRVLIQANATVNHTVTAENAKYLLVEQQRTVTEAINDEKPVEFTVNGISLLVSEKTKIKTIENRVLKSALFIPRFDNKFVLITDETITIPLGSRIFYNSTDYYQNSENVILQRNSGNQFEIVVFDVVNNQYLLKSSGTFDISDLNLLYCFYVRHNGECSLSPSLYKYNGNFAFVQYSPDLNIESIFKYNDRQTVANKLLQLRSVQDGNTRTHQNSKPLIEESKMLTLIHFSDIHADVNNLTRIVEFWNAFKDTDISDIIHTGDAAYSRIDDNNSVPNVFERVSGAERILNVVGNHDAWLTGTTWYEATSKQTYDYLFKGTGETPLVDNWGVIQPTGAEENGLCYYYKDYTSKGIRLIVLDCMHNNTDQETWFEGVLAETLDSNNAAYGYKVIIAVHYQSQLGLIAKNVTFNCLSGNIEAVTKSDYPTANTDVTDIPDITGTYHVERLPSRMYQKVDTFITNGGKFICWLCGHTHQDFFGTVPGYDNQLQITINTANRTKGDNYNWETRANHTQSCDCFNVIGFDTYHKHIKIVRIGINTDSCLRPINMLCYDYNNGVIISNT